MEHVLVTGGAGYVGSGLLRELLFQGYSVTCVDNLMFGGESLLDIWHNENFNFIKCDVNDWAAFNDVLSNNKFDAVIHLAAIVGDPACRMQSELAEQTNWESTKWLLDKYMEIGIPKFVFASTCSNYGKMDDPESYVDEDSVLAPVSLYAELKVKFEQYMLNEIDKNSNFSPTSLRFSTVYGLSPRMRFDLTVNEFTKDLALGRELIIFGEKFWRPYCHVKDFSNAFITVLRSPKDKVAYNVFNVGDTSENYTKQMLVEEIQKEKITTYSFNGSSLCHMRTMPHGIDIGFLKGAMLEDKLKQLHGETKRMRVLSLSKLIESEFDYYLVQALTLNK